MNDKSQERLNYLGRVFIKPRAVPSLRGLSAQWIGDTIHVVFFFDTTMTEDEREEAADIATAIISQFSEGFLSEEYLFLDPDEPLPSVLSLAYVREGETIAQVVERPLSPTEKLFLARSSRAMEKSTRVPWCIYLWIAVTLLRMLGGVLSNIPR